MNMTDYSGGKTKALVENSEKSEKGQSMPNSLNNL